jgi:hypothetical protein
MLEAKAGEAFNIKVDKEEKVFRISIRMDGGEFEQLMRVLNDDKAMQPICAVVDKSPLGRALEGSTYCASCTNTLGQVVCHQFNAKNWARAMSKAFWYCKGSFSLSRGSCGSGCRTIEKH